jgi:Beta-ketoacyl synthase, N-terminal domain
LTEVPPLARRRVERLGRLAFEVAGQCWGQAAGRPAVFASRHGDLARTVELLSALARGEALSPTSFSLSVHNAIGGQLSIIRHDAGNFSAVAAGRATAEAAFVEAQGLLADGHPEVLVVVYDAHLPAPYLPYEDEPAADFAWAVRLARADVAGLGLRRLGRPGPPTASRLPQALQVLAWLLGEAPVLEAPDALGTWRWERHG